ncbi:MAG: hypothetical protein WC679_06105 [Bacteroidales bacterium]|jgi:hypothetical protein
MKKIALLILLVSFSINLMAQDLIIRKNPKAEIKCKIIEIGEDLVSYSAKLGGEDRRFSIDKNNIEYIKFENGEILSMEDAMFGKNNYQDNTNNAIKFNFLSPLIGYTEFDYERSIKPGQSWEAGLGIIGLGLNNENDAVGAFISGGYRFYRSPDYYVRKMKYAHILKGSYVMPKIKLAMCNVDMQYPIYQYDNYSGYVYEAKKSKNIATLEILITGGKQWVYSNRFLIDLNFGIGYSFSNIDDEDINYYSLGSSYQSGSNFTCTAGLKIGYLFYDKKQPKINLGQGGF